MENTQKYIYSDENFDYNLHALINKIKTKFLKEDLESPYAKKEIILYDAPELKEISSSAIVTDKFIFIDASYFYKLSDPDFQGNNPQKMSSNMEFIKNINTLNETYIKQTKINEYEYNYLGHEIVDNKKESVFIAKYTDAEFISILKKAGYKETAETLSNKSDTLNTFNEKDKKFVINFNLKFSEFIHKYYKLDRDNETKANKLLSGFISKNVKDLEKVGDVAFGLALYKFSRVNIEKEYGFKFPIDFSNTVAVQINKIANTDLRYEIMINQLSGVDDFNKTLMSKLKMNKKLTM